jgi:hypothetical protein
MIGRAIASYNSNLIGNNLAASDSHQNRHCMTVPSSTLPLKLNRGPIRVPSSTQPYESLRDAGFFGSAQESVTATD